MKIALRKFATTFVSIFILITFAFPSNLVFASTSSKSELKNIVAGWNGSAYVGLKAPVSGGTPIKVSNGPEKHSGPNRHAVDFNMNFAPISAATGGTILAYKVSVGSAGMELDIDNGDGYCTVYLHLASVETLFQKVGTPVKQGDIIAKSGDANGNMSPHLHIEVDKKNARGQCNVDDTTPEIIMYFDEIPGRELKTNDSFTSQNYLIPPVDYTPPSGYTFCSNEGQRCDFSGVKEVAFGANGKFAFKSLVVNGVDCNTATFGDPLPYVTKVCAIKDSPNTPPSGFTFCAQEGGLCNIVPPKYVAFGAYGKYVYITAYNSPTCIVSSFGSDPFPYVTKSCYYTDTPGIVPVPTAAPLPTSIPAPIIDPNKVFDGGSSRLYQSGNWLRADLQVCAKNLKGKMVYVDFRRPDGNGWKVFKVNPKTATSNCVTFTDMDGSGPLNRNTTYYSRVALNQQPDSNWPIPCAGPTGGQGLCDKLYRP